MNGEGLRYGFTTGTAATAAATGAALWLLGRGKPFVEVLLPEGGTLEIPLAGVRQTTSGALGEVVKDAGDDPDVTDGLTIRADVTLHPGSDRVEIVGGEGVGIVTKPGLAVPVGSAAINPGPVRMIDENLRRILPANTGARVVVSVPRGEEVAKNTYNERLGIQRGISILGTRGIVKPMSTEALVATIAAELDVFVASGRKCLCLVPGNYGENVAVAEGIPRDMIVRMGNFVGETLSKVRNLPIEGLVLLGQVGKMMKVAGGSLMTDSAMSDGRRETFAALAARYGARAEDVAAILDANTLDDAVTSFEGRSWWKPTLNDAVERVGAVGRRYVSDRCAVEVAFFTLPHRVVACSPKFSELAALFGRGGNALTKIVCLGMGPGAPDYVTPLAKREAESLPVLLGESRFLSLVAGSGRKEHLPKGTPAIIARIKELLESGDVGILASGDVSFYSIGNTLVREFGKERVRLIPGISSLQILAARIGRSWANVPVKTLHVCEVPHCLPMTEECFFLLGGTDRVPAQIEGLCRHFGGERQAAFGWDLGLETELIFQGPLQSLVQEAARGRFAVLWVLP